MKKNRTVEFWLIREQRSRYRHLSLMIYVEPVAALPRIGRRTGADPIPFGARISANERKVSRLQTRIQSAVNDRIGIGPNHNPGGTRVEELSTFHSKQN